MAQIFHRSTNTLSRLSIFGSLFILGALVWAAATVYRSPYFTEVGVARDQPVPFSHKHHVDGLGLDCRYCHTSVEESAFAGIPPTETCMTCHSQIWADSPMLEPVRESYRTHTPLQWNRVHDLPDFVYFNHSAHVNNGIGCVTCHGQVDRMPLIWRESTLYMEWCLQCHRSPERFVRPRDQIFSVTWKPSDHQMEEGEKLVKEYGIERLDNCSTCHR
ncbi:MAG: cytochrome c3 family protein [Acidobacteriota bacterium]